jgi:hypothetical protein
MANSDSPGGASILTRRPDTGAERKAIMQSSPLAHEYEEVVDRDSRGMLQEGKYSRSLGDRLSELQKLKDPRAGPRVLMSSWERKSLSDLVCTLGHGLLDRLVGISRHVDIQLTELRRLGNVSVKRLLGVLRLDLPRLCK